MQICEISIFPQASRGIRKLLALRIYQYTTLMGVNELNCSMTSCPNSILRSSFKVQNAHKSE